MLTEYLNRTDWRVNANANQDYSLGGMILNTAGKTVANYWLDDIFSPAAATAHREGAIHIHDLDMLSGYCAGWSLRNLLAEGFGGVTGAIASRPPKHLSAALGQVVNFLGTLQNEWAGAQAFSSFDTYMAPYIRRDNLSYDQVEQLMQEFIFNLNVPSRWGTQTPFTNLTFDLTCPHDLKDQVPFIGGEPCEFTYGDLDAERDMINRAFIAVMTEGDADGRPFTFPIPTYNIAEDFDWEAPLTKELFTMTARYGLPYFQNFINSDLNPGDIRSMCCRLQLDLRELLKRGNGLFGSAELTGSIGVVTLNCARLGYLFKGQRHELFDALDALIDLSVDTLEKRRAFVAKMLDAGLYPYTKRWLPSLDNHFTTIGVNGLNELVRNYSDDILDITDSEGKQFVIEILDHINGRLTQAQEDTGHLYNLEATPAEGATYRLAKEDIKRYPDILHAGSAEEPYYTNSSQLPVAHTPDPFIALEHQDELQTRYTGGTVLHLYMGAAMSDGEACAKMVRRALENYRLPYITVTPTFSICPDHGYISGEHPHCPQCEKDTEMWTRVMGYFRPMASFNIGKKGEFHERQYFNEALV
ncbi:MULTISPECIES: ribonucleoside triphosphate reductase [unclassified Corynebacterium]|uniref:ribonucleoside triphosphate reductase n=1 Tax=unclassified Corynebacterium TaxID=2624378 RepID=UPI002168862C|nr:MULTISPECIES: ribonucleoside triphosphate reductase [unclassified Corynebacterium]MCS4489674.1 ribonucleoside triphosphate reductase [Corynebacterium sp. ES2775-CONJ]MCS4491317.1 ribonucleoside triphosphate reductase [Corynebacterium sp. ES2715-CONJ3]